VPCVHPGPARGNGLFPGPGDKRETPGPSEGRTPRPEAEAYPAARPRRPSAPASGSRGGGREARRAGAGYPPRPRRRRRRPFVFTAPVPSVPGTWRPPAGGLPPPCEAPSWGRKKGRVGHRRRRRFQDSSRFTPAVPCHRGSRAGGGAACLRRRRRGAEDDRHRRESAHAGGRRPPSSRGRAPGPSLCFSTHA